MKSLPTTDSCKFLLLGRQSYWAACWWYS